MGREGVNADTSISITWGDFPDPQPGDDAPPEVVSRVPLPLDIATAVQSPVDDTLQWLQTLFQADAALMAKMERILHQRLRADEMQDSMLLLDRALDATLHCAYIAKRATARTILQRQAALIRDALLTRF